MLALAHTGITLGAAALVSGAYCFCEDRRRRMAEKDTDDSRTHSECKNMFSPLASLGDIRILLIGSLLPDIIDKPLGIVFFPEIFHNSRIVGHTLFFLLMLVAAALLFFRKNHKNVFIMLSIGVCMHLILDAMWHEPRTLLWPAYGFIFTYKDLTGWLASIIHDMFTDTVVYVCEIIGGAILLWFAVVVIRTKQVREFILRGRFY